MNGTSPKPGAPALPNCHGFLDCKWKAITTDPYDVAQKIPCTDFLSCIEHGAEVVSSYPYNTAKAVLDDGKGIVDLVEHPTSLTDALSYIVDHPADTLRQLVWDDETAKLWQKGDYGGAVARTLWNVGSWVLPGVDIAKVFSKAGKFAKLGKLADKTGKLGRLARSAKAASEAADKAKRLAAKGDYEGARKAAADARRNADTAARQARKDGCAVALPLHAVPSLPHFGRFGAAALPACAMRESDDARQAREAEENAEHAANPPKEITGYTQHGEEHRLNRDGHGVTDEAIQEAVQHPKSPPVFTDDKYGGNFKYVGQDATVVLNKDGQVVTTWPTTRKGWRHP